MIVEIYTDRVSFPLPKPFKKYQLYGKLHDSNITKIDFINFLGTKLVLAWFNTTDKVRTWRTLNRSIETEAEGYRPGRDL